MRGNNRSKKKQFNPTKFILFGVSLILLCNVMPWKYFERRLKKGWTDITSFDDAMDFAKAYSSKAKVRFHHTNQTSADSTVRVLSLSRFCPDFPENRVRCLSDVRILSAGQGRDRAVRTVTVLIHRRLMYTKGWKCRKLNRFSGH